MSKLEVILENADYVIINKPVGLSVHNEGDSGNPTELSMSSGELSSQGSVLSLMASDFATDLFPVHRIDKETSGLLLLAKNKKAAKTLAEQFQNHTVKKNYLAVLRGSIGFKNWQWNWPLSDKAEGRTNPQGKGSDRKLCLTEGILLKENKYFSLVDFQIETGRQHQIRKHAAIAKHAIVGDTRYNEVKYNKMIRERYNMNRMFLHSARLEFVWNNEVVKVNSPVPQEFSELVR